MKRSILFLVKTVLLTGLLLMAFPRVGANACTATVTASPTATYTPTATATNVPPGVTPAPSLTPTPSLTPAPTLTYEQLFYNRAEVVFQGTVLASEKNGEWDESALVFVNEYYKGWGLSVVRVVGLSGFRLCNYFPGEPGTAGVFYLMPNSSEHLEYYPRAFLKGAPDGVRGRSPLDPFITFGWMESAGLGAFVFGGALVMVWVVRPRG